MDMGRVTIWMKDGSAQQTFFAHHCPFQVDAHIYDTLVKSKAGGLMKQSNEGQASPSKQPFFKKSRNGSGSMEMRTAQGLAASINALQSAFGALLAACVDASSPDADVL